MPYARSHDGHRLYYEEAGKGTPIVFVHEFSGDFRSWESQVQYFSRRYRCIAFNARGYPPSDVPERVESYTVDNAIEDIASVMRHIEIERAHIVGCSMGSQSTLHFGFTHPEMAISLTAIGAGSGSVADPAQQRANSEANAKRYEQGLEAALDRVRVAPNRVQLARKNPRAWDDFCRRFMEHSAAGCANTQRGIQAQRPGMTTLGAKFGALRVPLHVIAGDEDPAAFEGALFIKQNCPVSRVTILPATGHLANVEEPELVNRVTEQFFADVERTRRAA
jgi:pimeloyl-ACP methyl ester carboxylesterase